MPMPTIRISNPFNPHSSTGSMILPLSLGQPPSPTRSFRSTSRRLSYNLKSRASHNLPWVLGGAIALTLLFVLHFSRNHPLEENRVHLYSRTFPRPHIPDGVVDNGISLLLKDEDELIAEDDLFWDSYDEPPSPSDEELEFLAQVAAHKQDVLEHDRKHALRALIWWLAEGGVFPNDWEVPSKAYLRKVGGRGMERLLEEIESGEDDDLIFSEGWAEFAKKRYREVVFSKTHCPFSKAAKKLLEGYHLSPSPFIIELDRRSDMSLLQTLLQRLTGRRTVPNILLDFVSVGGADEITLLHGEGGLQKIFEEMEVLPGFRRRTPKPKPVEAPAARGPREVEAERAEQVAKAAEPRAPEPVPVATEPLVELVEERNSPLDVPHPAPRRAAPEVAGPRERARVVEPLVEQHVVQPETEFAFKASEPSETERATTEDEEDEEVATAEPPVAKRAPAPPVVARHPDPAPAPAPEPVVAEPKKAKRVHQARQPNLEAAKAVVEFAREIPREGQYVEEEWMLSPL